MVAFALVNFLSSSFINIEQSFSIYIPYADTTIVCVDWSGHLSMTICEHWAWTALYKASPVRLAMFVPPAKSVVDQISFMLPAISSVPWVDRDLFFVFDKTSLMPASWDALSDLSCDMDWVYSPAVADVMA